MRDCCATSTPVLGRAIQARNAFGLKAVEVIRSPLARLCAGLKESVKQRVLLGALRDTERAIPAAPWIFASV